MYENDQKVTKGERINLQKILLAMIGEILLQKCIKICSQSMIEKITNLI